MRKREVEERDIAQRDTARAATLTHAAALTAVQTNQHRDVAQPRTTHRPRRRREADSQRICEWTRFGETRTGFECRGSMRPFGALRSRSSPSAHEQRRCPPLQQRLGWRRTLRLSLFLLFIFFVLFFLRSSVVFSSPSRSSSRGSGALAAGAVAARGAAQHEGPKLSE